MQGNKKARIEALEKRFGSIKVIELSCRVVTPMFLGNATQEAALRPEPFKGLLRYWWRVATAGRYRDHAELLDAENKIFGGAGGDGDWGRSLVTIKVDGNPKLDSTLPKVDNVRHPEVKRTGESVNPLLYLGYGPITYEKGKGLVCKRNYIAPRESFKLLLAIPEALLQHEEHGEILKATLWYFIAFAAAGARSRNGWGSFQVENFGSVKTKIAPTKIGAHMLSELVLNTDYPHCLAVSKNRSLTIWQTRNGAPSWQEAMKELASIYINLRIRFPVDGPDDIGDRHLLGFPITNHQASRAPNWGKESRHASPLRLFVRHKNGMYYGFILHLPFGISKRMVKNASGEKFFTPRKQLEIWDKVHQSLDKDERLARVGINACF